MKMPPALLLVPERVWLLLFIGIFFLGAVASYVVYNDARALGTEDRIKARRSLISPATQGYLRDEKTKRGEEYSRRPNRWACLLQPSRAS